MPDPYRTDPRATPEAAAPLVAQSWACGELTIAVLLAAVGALGVGLGLFSTSSDRELSLGLLLLLLGAKVAWDYLRAQHPRATPRNDPSRR